MCGIAGYIALNPSPNYNAELGDDFLRICKVVALRGLDSFGFFNVNTFGATPEKPTKISVYKREFPQEAQQFTLDPEGAPERNALIVEALTTAPQQPALLLANFRGIPTTEAMPGENREAIQPFEHRFPNRGLAVIHNGLLSNDTELMRSYNFKPIMGEKDIDSYVFLHLYNWWADFYEARFAPAKASSSYLSPKIWNEVLSEVQGSFAVALYDAKSEYLHFARNYLGLWFAIYSDQTTGEYRLAWASEERAFAETSYEVLWEMPVGTAASLDLQAFSQILCSLGAARSPAVQIRQYINGLFQQLATADSDANNCAVVLSGGLDSTVVAAWACEHYGEVHLLHYHYGALAQEQERLACERITTALQQQYPLVKVQLECINIELFRTLGGSTLTDPARHAEISQGETGIEAPKEWVPARNLVLLALGAAYCDRHKLGALMLGFNREESGAFPDNSSEFYDACREPLSTGTLSKTKIISPVGNLMKRHIVKLAHQISAPIQHSWSCYRNHQLHCGTCAPCSLRLKAHAMDATYETVAYEHYPEWFPVSLRCDAPLVTP